MTTLQLMPYVRPRFFINNTNLPAIGYKLHSYAAGTTTPKATYADPGQITTNPNPIILNSAGEPDNSGTPISIYLSGNYKFVLADATDSPVWTVDNVQDIRTLLADTSNGASLIGILRSATGAVATTLNAWINSQVIYADADFGVVAGSGTDQSTALNAAAAAAAGNTLILPAGTISLSSSLNIPSNTLVVGRGKEATILKALAPFTTDQVIYVSSSKSNVVVKDLTVDGNSLALAGIQIQESNDCAIFNCEAKNSSATGYGFELLGNSTSANRNKIIGCTVSACYVGIFGFSGAKGSIIANNNISGILSYGIIFDGGTGGGASNPSNENTIIGNTLNGTTGYSAITIEGSHRNIVALNSITLTSASYAMSCDCDNAIGNQIPIDNQFIGNTINGALYGMRCCGQGTIVENNKLLSTQTGVIVQTSAGSITASKCRIANNYIEGFSTNGVQLDDITGNRVVGNEIYGGANGILAVGGSRLNVLNNVLYGQSKEAILLSVGAGTGTGYTVKNNDIYNSSTGNAAVYSAIKSITSGAGTLEVTVSGNDYFDDKGTPARSVINESGVINGVYQNNRSHNAAVPVYDSGLGGISETVQTLTGGAVTPNVSLGKFVIITATSNVTVNAPVNCLKGDDLFITVIESGAGAFTTTFNAVFKGVTWSETGNATGKRSTIHFKLSDAGNTWNQVSAQSPYA